MTILKLAKFGSAVLDLRFIIEGEDQMIFEGTEKVRAQSDNIFLIDSFFKKVAFTLRQLKVRLQHNCS